MRTARMNNSPVGLISKRGSEVSGRPSFRHSICGLGLPRARQLSVREFPSIDSTLDGGYLTRTGAATDQNIVNQ